MRKRPVRKKNPLYKSFGYAFEGIFNTFGAERNMKIHCLMAVAVIVAGIICRITRIEWFICLILFGLVTSLELVNTSVEAVVDLVTEEKKPLAKKAKDAAAGAVLIAAIFAALIGLAIFVPKVPDALDVFGINWDPW
ncbi:MAG: diacylglycerol kinase family protein [Lachnospiraceae bacterium]|nr:diacylglycerol kinase family protein [Lachnospiraceae bacterium]